MKRRAIIVVAAAGCFAAISVYAGPNLPQISRLRAESTRPAEIPAGATLSAVPDLTPTAEPQSQKDKKADVLRPQSRMVLVRYIYGEFARAVRALPALKKGYTIKVSKPLDEEALRRAVRQGGPAANPGDLMQVTRLEFRDKEIVIDLNGGSKERKRWRDRIQIGIGTGAPIPQVQSTTTTTDPNASGPPGYQRVGSTLIFDFGRPVPEMTPDEFKQILSAYLDFSKQRSATVHWFETLPPEFQQAIKEKRAIVGMDREMVVAAMGRPDNKIRERDPEGNETEDWIYGNPPGKTIFVKFIGEKVVAVREFPR